MAFSRMASGDVSPWRTVRARYDAWPSSASPLPEIAKEPDASAAGRAKQKAWNDGPAGLSTSGQTLLRATGFLSSFMMPQRSSVPQY